MPATKAANYTDEQVLEMRTAYKAAETQETREEVVVAIAAKSRCSLSGPSSCIAADRKDRGCSCRD